MTDNTFRGRGASVLLLERFAAALPSAGGEASTQRGLTGPAGAGEIKLEPGTSAAAAGRRKRPRPFQPPLHVGDLRLPAGEAGPLQREIVFQFRVVERPQRLEIVGELRVQQLADAFGPSKVLQPVFTEAAQTRPSASFSRKTLAPN